MTPSNDLKEWLILIGMILLSISYLTFVVALFH